MKINNFKKRKIPNKNKNLSNQHSENENSTQPIESHEQIFRLVNRLRIVSYGGCSLSCQVEASYVTSESFVLIRFLIKKYKL